LTFILNTHDNRTNRGHIQWLESSSHPITSKYVGKKYGPGYYRVTQNSPHTHKVWSGWIDEEGNLVPEPPAPTQLSPMKLASLEKKVNMIAVGTAGSILATGVGLGATAWNFVIHGQLLNRTMVAIDSLLAGSPNLGFNCGACGSRLVSVYDKYCSQCGNQTPPPDRRQPTAAPDQPCSNCSFPVRSGQHFCRECGRPVQSLNAGWRFP